jgi:hypothetical protein
MFKERHGLSKHPLHRIWSHIKGRCYNKTDHKYPYYGAIGVTMCDQWKNDFKAFYDWAIANGWKPGLQIDKDIKARMSGIIPGMQYSPKWCSFVTGEQNANCKRNNRFLQYNGKTQTIAEWGRDLNMSPLLICGRLFNGWPVEDSLSTQVGGSTKQSGRPEGTLIEHNGKKQNIAGWAREYGLRPATLWLRLKNGWNIAKALHTSTENTGKKK